MGMIFKLIQLYKEIIDNMGIVKPKLDVKPLHIDDIYGKIDESGKYIGPIYFFKLLKRNIKSLKVCRVPYVGLMGDNIKILDTIYHFIRELGIPTINLGKIFSIIDINRAYKLADLLFISAADFHDKSVPIGNIIGEHWDIKLNFNKGSLQIFVKPEIITSIVASLYVLRPIYSLLFNFPPRLMPIIFIDKRMINLKNGIYPIRYYENKLYILNKEEYENLNSYLISINTEQYIEVIEP